MILDALGAAQMERSLIGEMRDAGAEVLLFRPPKPYAIKRVANRTHRRVAGRRRQVGMTGGVGIAAEWMGDADGPDHWRDTHVRVRGPGRARAPGRVRGELARGDGRGARRR